MSNSTTRRTRILSDGVFTRVIDTLFHLCRLRIRPIRQGLHRVVRALQDVRRGGFTLVVRLHDEPLDVCFTRRSESVDGYAYNAHIPGHRNDDVGCVCQRL